MSYIVRLVKSNMDSVIGVSNILAENDLLPTLNLNSETDGLEWEYGGFIPFKVQTKIRHHPGVENIRYIKRS